MSSYAKKAKEIENRFYEKHLTYATYIVSLLCPIMALVLWALIEYEHIDLSAIGVPKNYNWADFLINGFIIGYFFFFVLATVDIVRKMIRKVALDSILKKDQLDLDLIKRLKRVYYVVGVLSIISIIVLSLGYASNNLGILMFKPYKRKIAPPGVGPGISESHEFDYS